MIRGLTMIAVAALVLVGAATVANAQSTSATLQIDKLGDGTLEFSWQPSCVGPSEDYAIYEGPIDAFGLYEPFLCSTSGQSSVEIPPSPRDSFYLVVEINQASEGSYGPDSSGIERPPASPSCLPQSLPSCS